MMSSCCTLRLKRRRAFSNDSPSCSRTSANLITSQPATNSRTLLSLPHLYCAPHQGGQDRDEVAGHVAVPHLGPITSPALAVKAAIREEFRNLGTAEES